MRNGPVGWSDSIRSRFAQTLVGQTNLRESCHHLGGRRHILIDPVPGWRRRQTHRRWHPPSPGSFKRVQCTPDLMPWTLVGTRCSISHPTLHHAIGPIHANFVCSTKSTEQCENPVRMLAAWRRRHHIGGQRIELPKPFMVIATQNPIEEGGHIQSAEAQMDRFMMKAIS